jgi:transposase
MELRTQPRVRWPGLRYPSDLSEPEWALVEPMIPPARHGRRKRSVSVREVLNATSI